MSHVGDTDNFELFFKNYQRQLVRDAGYAAVDGPTKKKCRRRRSIAPQPRPDRPDAVAETVTSQYIILMSQDMMLFQGRAGKEKMYCPFLEGTAELKSDDSHCAVTDMSISVFGSC